jgi:hypothetical protein
MGPTLSWKWGAPHSEHWLQVVPAPGWEQHPYLRELQLQQQEVFLNMATGQLLKVPTAAVGIHKWCSSSPGGTSIRAQSCNLRHGCPE